MVDSCITENMSLHSQEKNITYSGEEHYIVKRRTLHSQEKNITYSGEEQVQQYIKKW